MKIVLIGAVGQLGSDLLRTLKKEKVFPLTHQDIEVTDYKNAEKVLGKIKPEVVINTASYNRVDEAEDNPEKAFLVNALGAFYIAKICQKIKAVCVYISTDYVFDGQKRRPYQEGDCPNPKNVYGASKAAGEQLVRLACQKHFIIRTCGLYGLAGSKQKGGNFVDKMLLLAQEKKELKVVNDQILTPTYTVDLAKSIALLLKLTQALRLPSARVQSEGKSRDLFGTYHVTNAGRCSWYQFAKEILKIAKIKTKLLPISSEEFKAKAKRPKFSVLSHHGLSKLKMNKIRDWKKALKAYLEEREVI